MKLKLFTRHSLLVLCIIFFLVPFAMRGARLSIERMNNKVKDWLPANFKETEELTWFQSHFHGEQFILASWEGCTADDPKLAHLAKLLVPDRPEEQGDSEVARKLRAKRKVIDELGLYLTGELHRGWGGLDEKWLRGEGDRWFYITPAGDLHYWGGSSNWLLAGFRELGRSISGDKTVSGEFIKHLGPEFYRDPRRLEARLFKSVRTGPSLVEEMAGPDGTLIPENEEDNPAARAAARQVAKERLQGILFGPDGKQTCLIITLTDRGKKDLSRVLARGFDGPRGKLFELADQAGVEPPPPPSPWPWPFSEFFPPEVNENRAQLHVGGPPVDNVAIDEEGSITLVRLILMCALLGLGLAYISLRSVKATIMVFFVGAISAVTSVSIVYWSGSNVDAVLMSMPSLVYVLGLSGAVHIVNYYRDARREHGLQGAPEQALAHGWWPCLIAAGTTAIGLLSLNTSEIVPIKKFGTFSAIGVLATLFLLFLYMPAALTLFPIRSRRGGKDDEDEPQEAPADAEPPRLAKGLSRVGQAVAGFICRFNVPVAIVCTLVLAFFAYGLTKINTSVQLLNMFDGEARIIEDYAWLEENIGKLIPMELVLKIGPDAQGPEPEELGDLSPEKRRQSQYQLTLLERVELSQWIKHQIDDQLRRRRPEFVGPMMSSVTFLPDLPEPGPSSSGVRAAYSGVLGRNLQEIADSDYFRFDEKTGSELWRISLRLGSQPDVEYGTFVYELKRVVEPILAAYRTREEVMRAVSRQEDFLFYSRAKVLLLGVPYRKYYRTEENKARLNEKRVEVVNRIEAAKDELASAKDQNDEAEAAKLKIQIDELDQLLVKIDEYLQQLDEETHPETINDTRIFALTLHRALTTAGFSHRKVRRSDIRYVTGHMPPGVEGEGNKSREDGTGEPAPFDPTSPEWAEYLRQFDAVVLVDEGEAYDLDFLQQNAKALIDARGFHYERGEATGIPEDDRRDFYADNIGVVYTGVVPLVYKAQRTLLSDLITSTMYAFVAIAIVMMLLLRNRHGSPLTRFVNPPAGAVSMLPNVFPVVMIFGTMGWLGIDVDIGSMMTASVAMGVAVDDTIHFLTWFRRGMDQGLPRRAAIMQAYERVSKALMQTTLIGGLGLAVFAFSTFTPTQRFGTLMLALLAAALVGDLIFLPALLAGPLGKIFDPHERSQPVTGKVVEESAVAAGSERLTAAQSSNGPPGETAAGDTGPAPHLSEASASSGRTRHDAPHGE